MNIIAAVDKNMGIGYQNQLLVRIPNDQKWFQQTTMGKVIILGRKTLDTFPNKMPLKGRINIILTTDRSLKFKDAIMVYSMEELMAELKKYNSEDIYVVGGASVYEALLPYCDTAYITKIDYSYVADRYFPDIEKNGEWEIESESEEQTYFDLEYTFVKYRRCSQTVEIK